MQWLQFWQARASFVHRPPRKWTVRRAASPRVAAPIERAESRIERAPTRSRDRIGKASGGGQSGGPSGVDPGPFFCSLRGRSDDVLAFSFSFHSTFVWDAHTEAHHRDADPNIVKLTHGSFSLIDLSSYSPYSLVPTSAGVRQQSLQRQLERPSFYSRDRAAPNSQIRSRAGAGMS